MGIVTKEYIGIDKNIYPMFASIQVAKISHALCEPTRLL
jgi:hypothetical protein